MRRIVRPELLDTGEANETEVLQSLEDLKFVNRWFGGLSTTKQLIQRVLSATQVESLEILDVGAASGDAAQFLKNSFPAVRIRVTLLDRVPAHFNHNPEPKVAADALALPFRDEAFDLVMCSLFAHHLEPNSFAEFAREALRVCRVAFLVNDLRRSYFHLALVYAGMPLYRSRATRHDSVASVWRSYTPDELKLMLERTPATRVTVKNTFLCRMGVIAWKQATM